MTGKSGKVGRVMGSGGGRPMQREIEKKIVRRMARKDSPATVLRAFTLFGIIGWSVAVPVAVFAYLGIWLERAGDTPLTLSFIVIGFVIGCYDAYYWLSKEKRNLEK
jgi:ATP synthase protein I